MNKVFRKNRVRLVAKLEGDYGINSDNFLRKIAEMLRAVKEEIQALDNALQRAA